MIFFNAHKVNDDGKWDPSVKDQNEQQEVLEGHFVKGELNGFGRMMYIPSDNTFRTKYGFFRRGQLNGWGIYYVNDQT